MKWGGAAAPPYQIYGWAALPCSPYLRTERCDPETTIRFIIPNVTSYRTVLRASSNGIVRANSTLAMTKAKFATVNREFAMTRTKFSTIKAEFAKIKAKFATIKAKFATIKAKFATIKAKFATIKTKFATIETKFATIKTKFGAVKAKITTMKAIFIAMKGKFAGMETKLVRRESPVGRLPTLFKGTDISGINLKTGIREHARSGRSGSRPRGQPLTRTAEQTLESYLCVQVFCAGAKKRAPGRACAPTADCGLKSEPVRWPATLNSHWCSVEE